MVRHGRQQTVEETLAAWNVDPSRVLIDGKPYEPPKAKRAASTGDSVAITLPIPPHECSPNARCHWAKKARAVKAMRSAARKAASVVEFYFERPILSPTFYHKINRMRDRDNSISSLKSSVDGLADAELFSNDSKVHWGDVNFAVDTLNPRVVILISERPSMN